MGGTSGTVTENWETFRPDNLESEAVGARGAADRGGVSKNGSNK